MYETHTVGAKFDKRRTTKEIAELVRAELKELKAAGEFPAEVRTSVRKQRDCVRVTLSGWSQDQVRTGDLYGQRCYTPEARYLYDLVKGLLDQYNRDASDVMSDYFDTHFYGLVDWDVV